MITVWAQIKLKKKISPNEVLMQIREREKEGSIYEFLPSLRKVLAAAEKGISGWITLKQMSWEEDK